MAIAASWGWTPSTRSPTRGGLAFLRSPAGARRGRRALRDVGRSRGAAPRHRGGVSGAAWRRRIVHLVRTASYAPMRQRWLAVLYDVFEMSGPRCSCASSTAWPVRRLLASVRGRPTCSRMRGSTLWPTRTSPVLNRRLRSSNVQERANPGLKCRSRVVKVFPPGRSLVRMLDAVLSEMDEDWAAKRWFT